MNRPHLYFKNPIEGSKPYKGRPGGGGKDDDEKKQDKKDYRLMASTFSDCLEKYQTDYINRVKSRVLEVKNNFDAIELNFFAGFNEIKFKAYYIDNFGLEVLRLTHFNRKGLFAIEDKTKFSFFFEQLNIFISNQENATIRSYNPKIKFIKSFKLFSTDDRIGNINNYEVIHMSFMGVGSFLEKDIISQQKIDLAEFLDENKIEYAFEERFGEVYDIDEKTLKFILDNFDFIYATCSGSGAIVTPSKYNTPRRDYGFEVTNADQELPIIGVIDSGVSNLTPLAPLLVGVDGEYDSTGTGSFNDYADHGTGVAALAAFGNKLIPNYNGRVEADARVLPIKIIDNNREAISQKKVVDLIREANLAHGVRIFTLTIGYTDFPLKENQEFSSYAIMLDKLAAELDILIFISTTNHNITNLTATDYPEKFKISTANIAPPAESMNNITIGATANNFESNGADGLAGNSSFPALYSRKFHYNFEDEDVFNQATVNTYLRKPDLLIGGGDYQEVQRWGMPIMNDQGESCIEVLSSDLSERTFKALGTSYSTPLAANRAAQLLKIYPDLNMQSIKALLINAASQIKLGENFPAEDFSNFMKQRITGYGELGDHLLFSNEDKVTMIIEDTIAIDEIKLFPLHLPEYLNEAERENALLKFTTTLCFKFQPKTDNQLLYCPIHLSYVIGKNVLLEELELEEKENKEGVVSEVEVQSGYNGSKSEKYKIGGNKGWVQDFYYREKIVSNVQKHCFNVKRQNIIDEENTFKVAVNASFHKTLTEADKEAFEKTIPFSLIITIEQQPLKNESLDSLYDGLLAINELEAIGQIELEAEL
ncbi:MAG TPA: S8 family peptidase [Marinilabiliaceae bacterium]|nr:S8 family peptidase [Marinilabiliaceae bacterium]